MRILLFGNPNSFLLRSFAEGIIRENRNFQFDVLSSEKRLKSGPHPFARIIPLRFRFLLQKEESKSIYQLFLITMLSKGRKKPYDVIHIQSPRRISYYLLKVFTAVGKKFVVTYWGSDLLRATEEEKKKQLVVCEKADFLTFPSVKVQDAFLSEFRDRVLPKKLVIQRFGLSPLCKIHKLMAKQKKSEAKSEIGANPNDHVITLGYSAIRAQHHLDMLDGLAGLLEEKERIFLLLPFTYGNDDSGYIDEVRQKSMEYQFRHKFVTEAIGDLGVAKSRVASDIMIHAQPTDAFSGSMQEYLFAENVIINGNWLDYPELGAYNVFYYKFKDFGELSELIRRIIRYPIPEEIKRHNARVIWNLSNLKDCSRSWIQLYRRL